jgi:RES domain-containing protein
VVGEGWTDAADTSYSKKSGGRWNPSGAFVVLYLNATRATAKANAVRYLAGHGLEIEDL